MTARLISELIVVDDGDRDVLDQLSEIGLRVEQAIDDRCEHDQAEGAAIAEHPAVFVGKRSGDAAPRPARRPRAARPAGGWSPCDRTQAEPGQAEVDDGERAQHGEGAHRICRRYAAGRLVEQDLDVPAQRQDHAPAAGEYVHRQHRKADARKAEGRRADDAGQAEPEGEVPDEKLEQRAERQIGDDEQCRGGPDQDRIAAKRDLEPSMDDAEARQPS